jgi:hypothetical protein
MRVRVVLPAARIRFGFEGVRIEWPCLLHATCWCRVRVPEEALATLAIGMPVRGGQLSARLRG